MGQQEEDSTLPSFIQQEILVKVNSAPPHAPFYSTLGYMDFGATICASMNRAWHGNVSIQTKTFKI